MVQPSASSLVSGEGVRLELAAAGVGSRTLAAAIDAGIELLAVVVLLLLDLAVAGTTDEAAFRAVLITETVLVLAGYPVVSEWLTRGRTIGKAALGLRAVRDDGGPVGLRHALVRGLAGFLLEKPGLLFPFTTIAGLITMSVSPREKRLGDMLAGTVVLNERSAPQPLATPPAWVPVPLQPWVLALDLSSLDDRLALAMRQFVSRAHGMNVAGRAALEHELRTRVLAAVSPPPPPFAGTGDILMGVLAERRRRAVAGTPGPWRPPADPHVVAPSPPAPDGPFAAPS